jgi:hypothetical protein
MRCNFFHKSKPVVRHRRTNAGAGQVGRLLVAADFLRNFRRIAVLLVRQRIQRGLDFVACAVLLCGSVCLSAGYEIPFSAFCTSIKLFCDPPDADFVILVLQV